MIMLEWFNAFFQHVGTMWWILLLLDNCSAHVAAAKMAAIPPNVHICWLPPNSMLKFQPLDQGIKSFKSGYRRQWLQYMINCFEEGTDPMATMNMFLAL